MTKKTIVTTIAVFVFSLSLVYLPIFKVSHAMSPIQHPSPIVTPNVEIVGGYLNIDGKESPVGTLIEVYCDESSISGQFKTMYSGRYLVSVNSFNSSTQGTERYCKNGNTMKFLVNGVLASPVPVSGTIEFNGNFATLLSNININGAGPTEKCPLLLTPGIDAITHTCIEYSSPCLIPEKMIAVKNASSCKDSGDVNKDKNINLSDLSSLLSQFNKKGSKLQADLNGDEIVNTFDLSLLRHILIMNKVLKEQGRK